MKKKTILQSLTAVATLLAATACSDDLSLQGGSPDGLADGDVVEVTFLVSTEGATAATRADAITGTDFKQQTVGRASQVDMLLYAVYEWEESAEKYTLLKQYGSEQVVKGQSDVSADFTKQPGEGQTLVYDPFDLNKKDDTTGKTENNNGEYSISLRLMRGKEYTIAFWAQSSKSDAFETDDLEKVKVNYGNETTTSEDGQTTFRVGSKNNEELRDAFCKKETFTVGAAGTSRSVKLTRPLAQINVGTTGADFLYHAIEAKPSYSVAYSQITLQGVAQTINVVTDEIDAKTENLVNVIYAMELIPAYKYSPNPVAPQFTNGHHGQEPKGSDSGDESGETQGPSSKPADGDGDGDDSGDKAGGYYYTVAGEEFLFVDLNGDGTILPYTDDYPTRQAPAEGSEDKQSGAPTTETFKYLSMCYVLVPATTTEASSSGSGNKLQASTDDDDATPTPADPYTSSTLPSVSIQFGRLVTTDEAKSGDDDDDAPAPSTMIKNTFPLLTLKNVPVHRNWRTNILGGLYYTNPDDPNFPDDPTSVFKSPVIVVDKDPLYQGDYNQEGGDSNWEQNETDGQYGQDDSNIAGNE